MKRVNMIYYCVLSIPLLMGSIFQVSNYYSDKMESVNTEVVEYKQTTVVNKQYRNTYDFENLIDSEKGRLIEEKKRVEIDIEVSFYCSCELCCGVGARGVTAMGTQIQQGDVAIPQELNLNTNLLIPELAQYSANGQGLFKGVDRGGAIILQNGVFKIDVWVNSHGEALKLGRVRTKGWIVKN